MVSVKINRKDFITGCLQFVILDGRPFSIFHDDGFQLIVSPILREFDRISDSIPLSTLYIQDIARKVQIDVVKKIKFEMRGKLISLQLDLTNHCQRSILGINVQYYQEKQLQLRVLAMRRLNDSTSALNIANEVQIVLAEYDLDVDNIYTITTDNGGDVILCSQILQLMQERSLENHLSNLRDGEIDENELLALIEIDAERILQDQNMHFLHIVRCSAHTLQLAIGDELITAPGTQPKHEIIDTCRAIVKKLRAPTMVNLLNKRNFKLAKIDIDIRWSSIHDMVSLLIQMPEILI